VDSTFRRTDSVRPASLVRAPYGLPSRITTPSARMDGIVVLVLRRSQASENTLTTARNGRGTMTVKRGLTAAVVAAGVSLGVASPAWADDLSGTYALNLVGASPGPHTTWIASSTCAPSGGCVAHITSSTGWSGDAQLAGDHWTMTVGRPDGQSCPDGTRHAELQTWSWDAAALTGEVSGVSTDPTACPETGPDSFSLTKMRGGPASFA